MRFAKDLLHPGTYHLRDGRVVNFNERDIKRLNDRAGKMMEAGLQIPISWNHQAKAYPRTPEEEDEVKAEQAKICLGFVERARIGSNGELEAVLDVPNEEDAARLPSVRYVSPGIVKDFVDGSGRLWPGHSIAHIAVSPRPVQHNQQPFIPLSLEGFSGFDLMYLSLDDMEGYEEEEEDLPEEDEAEEEDTDTFDPPIPSRGSLDSLLEHLSNPSIGLILPSDTTAENLVERLATACMTKIAAGEADSQHPGTVQEDQAETVSMSLFEDDNPGAQVAKRYIVKDTKRRIQKLSNFIGLPLTKSLYDRLDRQPVQLSVDGGIVQNDLFIELAAYEKLAQQQGNRFDVDELDEEITVSAPRNLWDGTPRNEKEVRDVAREILSTIE